MTEVGKEVDQSPMDSNIPDEGVVMYASMPDFGRRLDEIESGEQSEETRRRLAEGRHDPYDHIVYRYSVGYVALHQQLKIPT